MSEKLNPPSPYNLDNKGRVVVKSDGRQYFLKPGRAENLSSSMQSFVFDRDNDDTYEESFKVFMTHLDLNPSKIGETEFLRQEFKRIKEQRDNPQE